MSPLFILVIIAAYFAILFSVSYFTGRKADNAGFFSGNRKSPWYVVAFATIGLDQDMMQKTLSCKNFKDSQKNMITGGILQIFVNLLFLVLGVLLYSYAAGNRIVLPDKGDEVFPFLATQGHFPVIVSILFIVGLISSAYAAAGSALTALTTSFTIDILKSPKTKTEREVALVRRKVHAGMAVTMGLAIFIIHILNKASVIDTVYKLASYTYGPLLGMFAFGIFTQRKIHDKWAPAVAIVSPVLCLILDLNSKVWFNGYEFSHERLILNALFTFSGLYLLIKIDTQDIPTYSCKRRYRCMGKLPANRLGNGQ